MTINDITPNCSRCQHSEWQVVDKKGKGLRCHKCAKVVQDGEYCGLFEPSQVVQDFFAGRLPEPDKKIVGQILWERQRAGTL